MCTLNVYFSATSVGAQSIGDKSNQICVTLRLSINGHYISWQYILTPRVKVGAYQINDIIARQTVTD